MKKTIKKVEYQTRTKDDVVWHNGFTNKRKAIRQRNATWPQIDVVRITTIIEVIDEGRVRPPLTGKLCP